MADAVDTDETPSDDEQDEHPVTELVEQVGRDFSVLAMREVELTAAVHDDEVRRGVRDALAAAMAVVAIGTAFLLANWAAVRALSDSLSGWRAPLLLAGVWVAVGLLLAPLPVMRFKRTVVSGRSRVLGGDMTIADREQARDEAVQRLRASLAELGAEAAKAGAADIAAAMVTPMAGGVIDVGGDILDAGEDILEEVVDNVPGGSVVGQVIDFALIPGRYGIRVATTVLKGGPPPEQE
jgi:hypothetical protein